MPPFSEVELDSAIDYSMERGKLWQIIHILRLSIEQHGIKFKFWKSWWYFIFQAGLDHIAQLQLLDKKYIFSLEECLETFSSSAHCFEDWNTNKWFEYEFVFFIFSL